MDCRSQCYGSTENIRSQVDLIIRAAKTENNGGGAVDRKFSWDPQAVKPSRGCVMPRSIYLPFFFFLLLWIIELVLYSLFLRDCCVSPSYTPVRSLVVRKMSSRVLNLSRTAQAARANVSAKVISKYFHFPEADHIRSSNMSCVLTTPQQCVQCSRSQGPSRLPNSPTPVPVTIG